MSNDDTYLKAFSEVFNISRDQAIGLKFQDIEAWDSVGHMALVAALEEAFDIMLEPDDIVELNSFEKGKEILAKYAINFK